MALDDVVLCSGGLRVAQRGADAPVEPPALRVGAIAAVSPPDSEPVEARRTDDVVWRRHWLEENRLVIEFVDLATVEVDKTGTVTFDRRLQGEMEQHLLFDHILPLVLARNGALVVHGGVISRDGKAIVLLGASRAGKSTLTAFAWQQAWTVGGDDGAVLYASDPPMVEPTYATLRLTPVMAKLLGIHPDASSSVAGKLRVAPDGDRPFRQDLVELRLIVNLEPAGPREASEFKRLAPADAHARLFGSTFHAELLRRSLLAANVERLASIVETTTVGRLTVPRGIDGLAAAEALLRAQLDGTRTGSSDGPGTQPR